MAAPVAAQHQQNDPVFTLRSMLSGHITVRYQDEFYGLKKPDDSFSGLVVEKKVRELALPERLSGKYVADLLKCPLLSEADKKKYQKREIYQIIGFSSPDPAKVGEVIGRWVTDEAVVFVEGTEEIIGRLAKFLRVSNRAPLTSLTIRHPIGHLVFPDGMERGAHVHLNALCSLPDELERFPVQGMVLTGEFIKAPDAVAP